jgi:cytochrome c5
MMSSNHRRPWKGGHWPVAERFQHLPIATVAVLALASGQVVAGDYASDTRAYNLAHGRVVFEQHCMQCHESGYRDAPVFGSVADWSRRLEQPLGRLIRHAIEGHGSMPPKGDLALSDQQVAAAVAFVVDRTRTLMPTLEDINRLPPTAAGITAARNDDAETASGNAAVIQMFMLLYGKERWR